MPTRSVVSTSLPDGAPAADELRGKAQLVQPFVDALAERCGLAFAVILPDGTRCAGGHGDPVFTVRFHRDVAILATFARGHLGLLEAYFDGDADLEGDVGAAFAAGMSSGLDQQWRP